jgi:hypothetical protein
MLDRFRDDWNSVEMFGNLLKSLAMCRNAPVKLRLYSKHPEMFETTFGIFRKLDMLERSIIVCECWEVWTSP